MAPDHTPFDANTLSREIEDSHRRSRTYGLNRHLAPGKGQTRLSPEGLARRREDNREFLEVATAQIKELYRFVAGAGFAVGLVDRDGYMLDLIGDKAMLDSLSSFNCTPGYRWTEKDVGTSAVSLALYRRRAVQLTDEDHYLRQENRRTCSASPVSDENGDICGVVSMTGVDSEVHPHTLGMVITATRAIENQLRVIKASKAIQLKNDFMTAVIESIDSGVLAVEQSGTITNVNDQARLILGRDEGLVGRNVADLLGANINFEKLITLGINHVDREAFVQLPDREVHLIYTAKPIIDSERQTRGVILVFNEIKRIRNLVNAMAGAHARFTFQDIHGQSPAIMEAKRLASVAAGGNSTVLLLGETGTGKELFAQAIHNQSTRSSGPFVAINCGAIPRELLESELFGYTEGAFTGALPGGRPGKFELAGGGTIFLDEIGDMPMDMQVKLLRVLQTGEVVRIGQHKPISVDLRIIAATNNDIRAAVRTGGFREDLYYRLNVFPITLPPLRNRHDDIITLARRVLDRTGRALEKPGLSLSPEAESLLLGHAWPGNIRELENVMERAVNLTNTVMIEPGHLALNAGSHAAVCLSPGGGGLLEQAEKQAIEVALEMSGHNVSQAAKLLGSSRATVYNKLRKYSLDKPPV